MSQDESTQPRASSAWWSKPVSGGKGMSSYRVMAWWLGRGDHNSIVMFDQKIWILGSSGLITEGDNITHRVKGGVSKLLHPVLFLCDADGESDRNILRGLSEVDVFDHEHGKKHQVGHSLEVQ